MFTLIIVDDERKMHQMLKKYIEQTNTDFKVVECFVNGKEAVEYLQENHVDVIFTDIKMPVMSGMELAQYVYENNIDSQVVIISGYGEFEYAKKAIEYGVFHYLLKAIDWAELDEILSRLSDLLKDKYENSDLEELDSERDKFFLDIALGNFSSTLDIEKAYKSLAFQIDAKNALISIYHIRLKNFIEILKQKQYEKRYFLDALMGIIEASVLGKSAEYVSFIHSDEENLYIVILNNDEKQRFSDEIANNLLKITQVQSECSLVFEPNFILEKIAEDYSFFNDKLTDMLITYIRLGEKENAKNIIRKLMKKNHVGENDNFVYRALDVSMNNLDKTYYYLESKLKTDSIIQSAKEYMENNYSKDIYRDDVAQVVGLNEVYFARYFKKETGITINDYLIKIRMKKALELLNSNMTVAEISEFVGFRNTRNFRRIFKNSSGYTPSEYRKHVLQLNTVQVDYED